MTNIAIIGSGPSGCYIADMLAKKLKDAQVDVFDRLPTPFGLVRAGVAPAHQGTKNIVRQLERTFARENVRFVGNVHIGTDITYQELKDNYDVVAVTIGAVKDRVLGIPGDQLEGIYGSGEFVAWYNGHPDKADLQPKLDGSGIAIIGNGNVALDIARVIAKTPSELSSSDITANAAAAIKEAPVQDIYLIGRRGPLEASFTNMELSEFAELESCVTLVDPDQIPAALPDDFDPRSANTVNQNLETLRAYSANSADSKPIRLHIMFCASPVEISETDGHVSGLKLEKNRMVEGRAESTGEYFELDVQTVISAIGYQSEPIEGMPFDHSRSIVSNEDGRVEQNVYTSGWCKRGPQGVIPANRAEAMTVAKQIISDLDANSEASTKPGFDQIAALLDKRHVRSVSYADWQIINNAEIERAEGDKPREKFTRVDEMLALLD
ncbi:FAD-dependent oxidoreductase [Pontibacterium sp.]|uniref:FAD-dependent oxidoreductase n=1 Tax=Pontibacterium sp. TaxID=2036026 RepID=UPI003516FCDC